MSCPTCQAKANEGRRFCSECGTPLPWLCHVCGRENAPRDRFCGACGVASAATGAGQSRLIPGTAPAFGEPERRQLTVVFADLVGSTGLGVRLDPEDLRDVIGAWRDRVAALVTRYGGLVTRHMGDGVLALFGYPRADEADAERAVRAGLAIIEAISRLDTVAGPSGTLATRVGMATGLVIAGDLIGAGSALEWSVVGETPNLAARLHAIAEPNSLVIDDATCQLTGRLFEYASLGAVELKGVPGTVRPWVVLGESAVESRFKALRPRPAPLVGREDERHLIQSRWAKAQSGKGEVVVIVGEPGIGKSRLIAGFEEQLDDTPRSELRLACSPNYQDTPLFPLIRYFENSAGFDRTDQGAGKFAKLQHLLRDTPGLGHPELVALATLLSLSPIATMPDQQDLRLAKERAFNAIFRHLEALAATAPLLAIVEDYHWADPTTMVLLDSLVNRVRSLSVLLIVSTRPDREPRWSREPHVTTRLLKGLDRSQAVVLVRQVAEQCRIADGAIARIVERAEGVPLFIEELTRSVLRGASRSPAADPAQPVVLPAGEAIPASLNALLMARLDQLGPGKEVAQASSVIGREFSFEMLGAVSGLPPARLEDALGELEEAGLIVADNPPPHATYVFHHVLIQEAAHASMLRDRRRTLHLRYANALENDEAGPVTTAPELLARHFAEAGVPDKCIDYYLKAAARATGRFALTEIIGYLEKGLAQLSGLPVTVTTRQRELELQVSCGRALMELRGAGDGEVRSAFERAHELCLLIGGTRSLLHIHDGLANYHFAHSDLDKVAQHGEQALELGRLTGDRHAVVLAHRSRGYARLLLGRFHEAREDFEEAIKKYDGEMAVTRDPKVSVCAALGICLTVLGFPNSGTSMSLMAIRHGETLAHPVSINLGLRRACVQAMICRDAKRVLSLSARLLYSQSGLQTFRGEREGALFSAWAHLQTSWDPAFYEQLRAMLRQLESARFVNLLPFYVLSMAELIGSHGNSEEAGRQLCRAADLVERTDERWCEAEILRLRARLASDPEIAIGLLKRSLSLAREQAALLWEWRAATDFASLLKDRGEREAARSVLAAVLARVSEGWLMPEVRAARGLLEVLTGDGAVTSMAAGTGTRQV